MEVKEYIDQVYTKTEYDTWRECQLVLASTNLIAMDARGVAIGSKMLNRRVPESQKKYSALMKLVLVDEYSMIFLG